MHEPGNEATLRFTFMMYKVPIKTCTEMCMNSLLIPVCVCSNSLGPGVHIPVGYQADLWGCKDQ